MSFLSDIESDLQIASPYATWLAGIIKAAAGSSSSTTSTAASTVASTATTAAAASVSLGITSDVGAGFNALTSITNLVAQRDKELNADDMVKAATAQKLQDLRDHAIAQITYAESTGDFAGLKLLLS